MDTYKTLLKLCEIALEEITIHNVQCKENPLWPTAQRDILRQFFVDRIIYRNEKEFKRMMLGDWNIAKAKEVPFTVQGRIDDEMYSKYVKEVYYYGTIINTLQSQNYNKNKENK